MQVTVVYISPSKAHKNMVGHNATMDDVIACSIVVAILSSK